MSLVFSVINQIMTQMMTIVLGLRDHLVVPFCVNRSLLKNSQCRQSLAGSAFQVRLFSYFRLYFWASSINGSRVAVHVLSFTTASAAALWWFPSIIFPWCISEAWEIPIFQSAGLDGCLSNTASISSIPLHSLPHLLQEQMNGALANGSGYQSDSSATQSPPQALWVPSQNVISSIVANNHHSSPSPVHQWLNSNCFISVTKYPSIFWTCLSQTWVLLNMCSWNQNNSSNPVRKWHSLRVCVLSLVSLALKRSRRTKRFATTIRTNLRRAWTSTATAPTQTRTKATAVQRGPISPSTACLHSDVKARVLRLALGLGDSRSCQKHLLYHIDTFFLGIFFFDSSVCLFSVINLMQIFPYRTVGA